MAATNVSTGPEKLLEVWFCASPTSLPIAAGPAGLKVIPAEVWKDMLDLVNCKILSVVESDQVDAYLLSESSMFVFPHKLILKTCGTTTLLYGLPKILEIAALMAGFPHTVADLVNGIAAVATPYRVFYSRKNFQFPDRQRGPHRSWRDEVRSLDKLFLGGSAYMIGKMNGEHWYLYLTEPNTILTPPATPERIETETRVLDLPAGQAATGACEIEASKAHDETLEILMTDLDKDNAKQFYLDHASAVAEDRYYQQAYKARVGETYHLGTINEDLWEDCDLSAKCDSNKQGDCLRPSDPIDIFCNKLAFGPNVSPISLDGSFPEELTTEGHELGTVVSESSGLADIYPVSKYPDARIDAYLFTPCGFSANGVIPAPTGSGATHYFTVHVTPEPHCSYASFETNVPLHQTDRDLSDVVEQVVSIFKPARFSVTLFEAKALPRNGDYVGGRASGDEKTVQMQIGKKRKLMESIRGYRRVDRIVHDLDGYELVFKYYERFDWEGGAPRLGEAGF